MDSSNFTCHRKRSHVFWNTVFVCNKLKRCLCCIRSVVAYKTTVMPIHSMTSINEGGKLSLYDSVDEEVLRCYREFSLANLIFYAMKESACSEQSQRMTAMDGATKNAGLYILLS